MNLRVNPQVKEVAELAAERDNRSLASFIEVIILAHCKRIGIKTEAKPRLPEETAK